MKKKFFNNLIIFCLIITIVLGGTYPAAAQLSKPEVKAKTAMIYYPVGDDIIWEKDAEKAMNPASMTKLMTALIAAEHLELSEEVTVTAEALDVIPTMINLKEGEVLTVGDLMHASLMESANDAAAALAIATAGSISDFATMMNAKAEELGCTNTNFANPHGLYNKKQYSCAADMVKICRAALANDTVRAVAQTLEYSIEETNKSEARKLENYNLLLNGGTAKFSNGDGIETYEVEKYEGIIGGKTGTTEDGQATMVVCLDWNGMELYAVIMGSTMEYRYPDITTLLDYAKKVINQYAAFKKGAEFEPAKLYGGATNRVVGVAAKDGYINLPEGASPSLITTKEVYPEDLQAPIKKGDKVGVVEIYLADEKMGEVDLLAKNDVAVGWILSKYRITNFQTILMCSAVGLVVLFFITVTALRISNKRKKKLRRQQRIMEEARRQLEREASLKERGWPY